MSTLITDTVVVDGFNRTKDGFIAAMGRAARTGVQLYDGASVGRPDLKVARVHRPAEEVFSPDALKSFAWRPMTNDHPSVPVSADNWRDFAVGQVGGDVLRDGDTVRVPLVLMDARAIADFDAGKRELSMGYFTDVVWEPGTTEDGQEFDGFQTNIRANHLALVASARGGPRLRVGDDQEEKSEMTEKVLKTVVVDGLSVQVSDQGDEIINRHIKQLTDSVSELTKKVDDATKSITDLTKQVETKDAEIVTLKKQVEDAQITGDKLDQMVAQRESIIARGRALLGDGLKVDGISNSDIMRSVVTQKLGDVCKDWTEDQVAASFETYTADIKPETPSQSLGRAFESRPTVVSDKREEAYTARNKRLEDAWKSPQGNA